MTVISNVVDSIYEGLFGFSEDFDKNVPDLDKDVSKLEGEMDEAKPLIEKIKELAEKAKKAADNMEGENLLRPFDKGTLETGESYEVFNIFDENKQVVPYIRITDEQGAVKTLSLEEYQNSLKKNIIKDNPKLKNLIDTDKYMGEKNQWWDFLDVFPNQNKFDSKKFMMDFKDSDFTLDSESVDTEVIIIEQPILVD